MKNCIKKSLKASDGITLIALVITIIILIILAAISINLVLGENGILQRTRDGRNNYQVAANEEAVILGSGESTIDSWINGNGGGSGGGAGGGTELEKGPKGKPLVNKTNIPSTSHEKIIGEDEYGNQVVVPDGFKVADDSGTTVKDGIVIEDSEGNQYVWIPVSNIDHSGKAEDKIKVNSADEEGVEITLGRYTFDTTTGEVSTTEGTYQYALVSTNEPNKPQVALGNTPTDSASLKYYKELTAHRESNFSSGIDGTNTTAKELVTFINSVSENKGYYIARYEASYRESGKVASKVSTSTRTSSSTAIIAGMLWNFVKQGEAATACQNLYSTIKSDLMNSYAWDTAIVYIQAMGNTNYANANRGSNTTLMNTGATGDQKCKIFDMAGNTIEWTTEYSSLTDRSDAYPCVGRGGSFSSSSIYTRSRPGSSSATNSSIGLSFRPTLYL